MTNCLKLRKSIRQEFHYSKLCFSYHSWKAFTYTPWLPYKWKYQTIYLVYRWCIAIYFSGWIITSGVKSDGPRYFVFLTHWGFITFGLYLTIAALSATAKFLTVHVICPQRYNEMEFNRRRNEDFSLEAPSGCCGCSDNKLTWYQMTHWFFFNTGNMLAFGILVLYWGILYEGGPVDGINLNAHLFNGLVAVADLWVSGVPINLLHFIWIVIYGAIYCIFTGVYFVLSGGDIIYTVLDYRNKIGPSVGLGIGVVVVYIPFIHIVVFFLQYKAKFWILHWYFGRNLEQVQEENRE